MDWSGWLTLFVLLRIASGADINGDALLMRVRAKVVEDAAKIPRYVCRQQIERRVFSAESKKRRSCSAVSAQPTVVAGLRLDSVDRAKLDVMLAKGTELFSWPGAHRFNAESPGDLLAGGMSGSGDFASFPISILTNARVTIEYQGACDKTSCVRFRYDFPREASHYSLTTPKASAVVGYHGTLDVDPVTAELLSLTAIPTELQKTLPDVCDLRTQMVYARTKSEAGEFMIPTTTEKDLTLRNGSFLENKVSYEGCRQYLSESTLTFDDEAPKPEAKALPLPPAPEAELELRLISTIDSEKSFAGDMIEAALVRPVRDTAGGTVPAGTIVRGHLAQVEREYSPLKRIIIAIRFDSIRLSGVESPLTLDPVEDSDSSGRGLFVYPGAKVVLGENFVSRWIVLPSAQ